MPVVTVAVEVPAWGKGEPGGRSGGARVATANRFRPNTAAGSGSSRATPTGTDSRNRLGNSLVDSMQHRGSHSKMRLACARRSG